MKENYCRDTNAELVLAGNIIPALPKEYLKLILSHDTVPVDEILGHATLKRIMQKRSKQLS